MKRSLIVSATSVCVAWAFFHSYGKARILYSNHINSFVVRPPLGIIKAQSFALYDDGYANAPPGPIQRPALLAGYSARPPWKVAGVDYAVGIPAGTVLTDWQNLKGPGISINGNMVRIDNTNGVHHNLSTFHCTEARFYT